MKIMVQTNFMKIMVQTNEGYSEMGSLFFYFLLQISKNRVASRFRYRGNQFFLTSTQGHPIFTSYSPVKH
jgi:hypothetical protein